MSGGGGNGGVGGWGVIEVISDLLAACFAKESLFPRKGETDTHNTHTNKYMASSLPLNTVHTHCKSPPAFGYSAMYTCIPTDTHKQVGALSAHRKMCRHDKLLC